MAGNKTPQDEIQDMRDGWVDGSCSELLNDIFGIIVAAVIIVQTLSSIL